MKNYLVLVFAWLLVVFSAFGEEQNDGVLHEKTNTLYYAAAIESDCRGALPDRTSPLYYMLSIDNKCRGGSLEVVGNIAQSSANYNPKAALMTVRFLDEAKNCCGVGGLPRTKAISTEPGYFYLSSRSVSEPFKKEVTIPTNAAIAEVGFCSWSKNLSPIHLRDVKCAMSPPLEAVFPVRMISWGIRHCWIVGSFFAIITCVLLIFFCWQYKSDREVSIWLNTVSGLGILLACFALSYAVTDVMAGMLVAILMVVAIVLLKRQSWCSARDVYVIVFSLGIAMRLLAIFSIEMIPYSDFLHFWEQSVSWSESQFVGTKSYPTVAFYSLLIRLFGAHYIVVGMANTFLGVLQMWLAKDVAAYIFKNKDSGILSCSLIGLNPILIVMTPAVASEIFYGTLVLLSFWLFLKLYDKIDSNSRSICIASIAGFVALITMFARGNGAGVVPAGCCVLAMLSLRLRRFCLFIRYSLVPIFCACVVMISAMCVITYKTYGYVCPTGSNQQKWVYLFGANIKCQGNGIGPDNALVRDLFSERYPGKRFNQKDADPIIMSQFKKRWMENTSGEVALSFKKHYWVSQANGLWSHRMNNDKEWRPQWFLRYILTDGVSVLRSALILFFVIGSVCLLVKRQFRCLERLMMVVLFYLFNVVMTFVTVWTPRYSYTLWIVLPIMASAFMSLFERRDNCA